LIHPFLNVLFMRKIFINIILSALFILPCFISCNQYERSLPSDEFLTLNLDQNSDLVDNDIRTIITAFNRMSISAKDGIWESPVKSHSEINISEDLFNLLNTMILNHNKYNIRTKSSDDPERTDCVLRSLEYLGDYSAGEIKLYIDSQYNGIVTIYNVEKIVKHFYPSCEVYSADSLTGNEGFDPSNTLGYFSTSECYHMVNPYQYHPGDSLVIYYDAQNGGLGSQYIGRFNQFFKVK
jgi:hypothetical protein